VRSIRGRINRIGFFPAHECIKPSKSTNPKATSEAKFPKHFPQPGSTLQTPLMLFALHGVYDLREIRCTYFTYTIYIPLCTVKFNDVRQMCGRSAPPKAGKTHPAFASDAVAEAIEIEGLPLLRQSFSVLFG
jgi:hypothetical protein